MNNKSGNTTQPILFMDLDGTLIKWAKFDIAERCAQTLNYIVNQQEEEKPLPFYISQKSISLVRDLRAEYNAKLVVHSNWTTCYSPEVTINELLRHGFEESDFHQDWCLSVNLHRLSIAKPRANQDYAHFYRLQRDSDRRQWRIPLWLMLHPDIDNFVIFDDQPIIEWEKTLNITEGDARNIGFNLVGDSQNGPFHSRWVRVKRPNAIEECDIAVASAILAKAETACVWRLL